MKKLVLMMALLLSAQARAELLEERDPGAMENFCTLMGESGNFAATWKSMGKSLGDYNQAMAPKLDQPDAYRYYNAVKFVGSVVYSYTGKIENPADMRIVMVRLCHEQPKTFLKYLKD